MRPSCRRDEGGRGLLIRFLESCSALVEKVAGLLLAAITLLIAASAIGRYLFAAPIPDSFDIARLLLGATVMWGFASLGYRGSHIQVDILAEVLPARARRAVDLFAWIALLIFVVLLTWKMFARVESAMASGESTFDLRLPVWPLMALIWAGVLVAVLTSVARLILIWNDQVPADEREATRGDSEANGARYE